MVYLLAVVLAYLVGSFPSGVVVVRLVRGFDVRRVGSKRSGATNVLRSAGVVSAVVVFLLDLAKGAAAVLLGQWLAGSSWVSARSLVWFGRPPAWPLPLAWLSPMWAGLACGLAAVAGHNWPIYIRFHGGRGVTTSLGTVIPLSPWVALGAFVCGILIIAWKRYVSLGSVIGASLIPAGLLLQAIFTPMPVPVILYGLLVAGMIILQHGDNIARLRAGTERKLGEKVEVTSGGAGAGGQASAGTEKGG
jgi:glycerol-3-phosphate acyltransferase PlsY